MPRVRQNYSMSTTEALAPYQVWIRLVIRGAALLLGPIVFIFALTQRSWVGAVTMAAWSIYWGWRLSSALQDYETLSTTRSSHQDPNANSEP